MTAIRLREALFRVDPIKNIVGQGDTRAFHIVVTKGETIGSFGPVAAATALHTGNDSTYETAHCARKKRCRSWLQRLLTALKS